MYISIIFSKERGINYSRYTLLNLPQEVLIYISTLVFIYSSEERYNDSSFFTSSFFCFLDIGFDEIMAILNI